MAAEVLQLATAQDVIYYNAQAWTKSIIASKCSHGRRWHTTITLYPVFLTVFTRSRLYYLWDQPHPLAPHTPPPHQPQPTTPSPDTYTNHKILALLESIQERPAPFGAYLSLSYTLQPVTVRPRYIAAKNKSDALSTQT